jgi:hypothetical protein
MLLLWVPFIVAGVVAVGVGIALWRRASERYAGRTGERWGPPSAPAYFLVVGGMMAAGIGAVMLAVG